MPDGEAIEAGIVTRSIESAQRKVEARNFDIRKQLLEYDDVSNDQRKVIYQQRNEILDAQDLSAQIAGLREGCFTDLVRQFVPPNRSRSSGTSPAAEGTGRRLAASSCRCASRSKSGPRHHRRRHPGEGAQGRRRGLRRQGGAGRRRELRPLRAHGAAAEPSTPTGASTSALDYLRQGIHLRGYAQKQPKQEYKREAFELFGQLLDVVKNEVTRVLMTVRIQSRGSRPGAAGPGARAEHISNVTYTAPTETGEVETTRSRARPARPGRRRGGGRAWAADPCPCGSGKVPPRRVGLAATIPAPAAAARPSAGKYKQCHGKLALSAWHQDHQASAPVFISAARSTA
jgi:preprotein translocase subunit SecA